MADNDHGESLARGFQTFAGIMLIIGGAFQAIQSIAALVNDKYLIVLPSYVFSVDLTAWGWIHLLIGLGLVAVGVFLLLDKTWARIAGIVLAAISALLNFAWLPHSPLWAVIAIAVDILVIAALASPRDSATRPQQRSGQRRRA
jgi:hypothetical protein